MPLFTLIQSVHYSHRFVEKSKTHFIKLKFNNINKILTSIIFSLRNYS